MNYRIKDIKQVVLHASGSSGAGFIDGVWHGQPQKKEWVGLTDEELDVIYEQHHNQYGECESPNFGYERAIEQTLKEKNHG